jgi:cation diffusion facilitator family transporter
MEKHPSAPGIRATLIGILFNVVLVIAKALAGVVGHSHALVADAIESASDVFTSVIVFIGLKISGRKPDHYYPYGKGKAEPVASFMVGLILLLASIVIIVQSIHNILTPHEVPEPFTLWVLLGVIVIKEGLFRFVFRVGLEIQSTAVKGDAWHHRSDALTSAAAFIGISIALYFGKGYEAADDWAALAASGIIIFNAIRIIKPSLEEIMDKSPAGVAEEVRRVASLVAGVLLVEKCYVRKMGFEYFVDLHIHVDAGITVLRGHEIAHQVKDALKSANSRIYDVLIHVEPAE